MTRVKICGLTRASDVEAAVDSGADALGFISGYINSPRNLRFDKLEELISRVPPFVDTVVVTPPWNIHRVGLNVSYCAPDIVNGQPPAQDERGLSYRLFH